MDRPLDDNEVAVADGHPVIMLVVETLILVLMTIAEVRWTPVVVISDEVVRWTWTETTAVTVEVTEAVGHRGFIEVAVEDLVDGRIEEEEVVEEEVVDHSVAVPEEVAEWAVVITTHPGHLMG